MDGTVTRSNEGTHDEPKFSLKTLSLKFDFPKIKKLLRDCASKYYGYIPIIQGDDTGLHNNGEFVSNCSKYSKRNGMHWEPHAPQMPYLNNLDLAVFPAMNRRHADLLGRVVSNTSKNDEI